MVARPVRPRVPAGRRFRFAVVLSLAAIALVAALAGCAPGGSGLTVTHTYPPSSQDPRDKN